jgi:hypothetical protein
MNIITELGKVGKITWMYQDVERVIYVERSTGRNIGYKTETALRKNIKQSVKNFLSNGLMIVSVEILTLATVATDTQTVNVEDL